ncbi:hypothetical protein N7510_003639 [Penicillium lagena]|uniref:uncharacterized protein n=1 Tax=Penicillium lagena TaxID=94218 RepID=UPI0025418B88|nr:uncharacterized protein N7510_003639 [Penicillium lagena]KAJ5619655.1 hypothetical protein N7510_003639 [Penicillium lagena]
MAEEPLFKSFLSGMFSDLTTPPREPAEWTQDESMARFISRRFNSTIADNLLSAVMHGIYAGDIDRLSAQTLLGGQRNLEAHGGVLAGLFKLATGHRKIVQIDDYLASISMDDYILGTPSSSGSDLAERLGKASTFAFKNGNSRLVDALEASLKESPKVKVVKSADITSLRKKPDTHQINITSPAEGHQTFDRVIATIPAPELAQLLASSNHSQGHAPTETIKRLRKQNYATTVRVVNLYYENPSLLPPGINGFGYLIPRSIPFEQNPECGLGVIFSAGVANDGSPLGTQLTVMFGGHYWDGWKDSDYPDHDSAVEMARTMLERHLGIKEKPLVTRSQLQKNAIPQYTVGHLDRMYLLSKTVRDEWDKRLTLAGNWYNGVGVPACVKQGVLAAQYGIRAGLFDHHNAYPLRRYDIRNWELEGGLVMPPVRLDEWDKSET